MPKEIHSILTETLACFLPGQAKDLSAPLYYTQHMQGAEGDSRHSDRNISLFPSWPDKELISTPVTLFVSEGTLYSPYLMDFLSVVIYTDI